jgi:formate/nitrite transporter
MRTPAGTILLFPAKRKYNFRISLQIYPLWVLMICVPLPSVSGAPPAQASEYMEIFMSEIRIDALLPAEMATRAEYLGVRKAEMPVLKMFTLAILAGAFISLGAIFATTVSAGSMAVTLPDGTAAFSAGVPYGIMRLLVGLVFCLGLILVVVGGAELFTGNNLIVMAWASGKVTGRALLRNWLIVYAGNFVGAVGTAILMFLGKQYTFGSSAVGIAALKTAIAKCDLSFGQALVLGILCNALVCLAVWLTFSARSTIDKIAAIIFPITAFVAAGFEHSVANMYFIPFALFIKDFDAEFMSGMEGKVAHLDTLTWGNFIVNNLLPVTIGNVIGGAVLVAAVYWSVFLRNKEN